MVICCHCDTWNRCQNSSPVEIKPGICASCSSVLVLCTNADFRKPSRAAVQATCEKLCELPQTDVARVAARHGIVIPLGTRPTRKHFLDSFCHRLAYTMQQMALDTLKTILGGPANAVHVLVLVSLTDAVGNACSYPEFVSQSNIVHQVGGTGTGSLWESHLVTY